MTRTLLALTVALAFVPVAAAASPVPDPHAQIAEANLRYVKGFQARDFALMASDYELDGRFIAAGREISGRRNVEHYFANRAVGVTMLGGNCTTEHLQVYGSTATEMGACDFSFRKGGRTLRATGHYVTVWAYHARENRWFIRFNVIPD